MSSIQAVTVLFVLPWTTTKGEETQVSCVFNKSCVLPCRFEFGPKLLIHWFKTPGDVPVHSYYYGQDQFSHQHQDFKDRTSLFVDQFSRGNASLLLGEVKLQDEGTYKCFTSTTERESKNSFINLRTRDPPSTDAHIVVLELMLPVIVLLFLLYLAWNRLKGCCCCRR